MATKFASQGDLAEKKARSLGPLSFQIAQLAVGVLLSSSRWSKDSMMQRQSLPYNY